MDFPEFDGPRRAAKPQLLLAATLCSSPSKSFSSETFAVEMAPGVDIGFATHETRGRRFRGRIHERWGFGLTMLEGGPKCTKYLPSPENGYAEVKATVLWVEPSRGTDIDRDGKILRPDLGQGQKQAQMETKEDGSTSNREFVKIP